ncbi:MAG: tetratricopeptide repeat protein [Acidobacteriota bacterium]
MKTLRFLSLLAAFILASLLASTAEAKDKWINVRTKNFNIVSNASQQDTREVALKLEQFVYVFSKIFNTKTTADVPVTVVVFKDDGSFKPFKPLYNGKPANIAGYFQRGEDENIIALNISGNQLRPLATIFHEYTHLLTSYTARQWPAWLMEGIAEFYSSFEMQKQKVTIGAPISSHVFLLRENKFLPLQTLFTVARNSPEYNERSKQGIFYAQSWAFAHYLMLGNQSARQKQLNRFIKSLEAGASADQVFREVFQTDYATMEKELRRYIGNDTYTVVTYTLDQVETPTAVDIRPLNEAEVQSYLGMLLMRSNRFEEAETYFKQAIALDPNLARPYEGMGFIAIRRSKFDEAREHLKQATSRDSKNHLAHYYYAAALQQGASLGSELNPETTKKIIEELKTTINLMPGFAPAYSMLGFMLMAAGEDLNEAARVMKTAIRLAPQNRHLAIMLAQIQLRMEDYSGAKKTLEPLLSDDSDPAWKSQAKSLTDMIDRFTAARAGEPEPRVRGPESKDEKQISQETHREKPAPPPSIGGSIRIADAVTMDGVLVALECNDDKFALALKTADKVVRFTVSDMNNLRLFTLDPNFRPTIGCGPINLKATVHYKPTTGGRFVGDAIAVEFKK